MRSLADPAGRHALRRRVCPRHTTLCRQNLPEVDVSLRLLLDSEVPFQPKQTLPQGAVMDAPKNVPDLMTPLVLKSELPFRRAGTCSPQDYCDPAPVCDHNGKVEHRGILTEINTNHSCAIDSICESSNLKKEYHTAPDSNPCPRAHARRVRTLKQFDSLMRREAERSQADIAPRIKSQSTLPLVVSPRSLSIRDLPSVNDVSNATLAGDEAVDDVPKAKTSEARSRRQGKSLTCPLVLPSMAGAERSSPERRLRQRCGSTRASVRCERLAPIREASKESPFTSERSERPASCH